MGKLRVMIMGITRMPTSGLYQLMSWMSPSYPVGSYTYSHGVEYAVEAGLVLGADDLVLWLKDILQFGGARTDVILLVEAYRAFQGKDKSAIVEIAELGYATRSTREFELETTAQGRAFVDVTQKVAPSSSLEMLLREWDGPIVYPIAVAAVAADNEIALVDVLTAYLHSFVSNIVSAAVRIIPLGQTDGQKSIGALEEVTSVQVQEALSLTIDDIGTATLMMDWCSSQHETQYTRLFRS
ncbi:MAG: urease accessory protein UreF [Sneathiella sp.]|nr:urease accessory protein UreF [Sneathiella sp.]